MALQGEGDEVIIHGRATADVAQGHTRSCGDFLS